jgi:hypothetical protein
MKTNVLTIILMAFFIYSCENNEDEPGAKPTINFTELGYKDSKTATIGEDFHMEAYIEAENKIDKFEVELHPEGEHMKSYPLHVSMEEWEFDSVYTGFSGLRNTEFHEHIEIPESAEPGDYHFHFAVIDQEGFETVYEAEVELLSPGGSK